MSVFGDDHGGEAMVGPGMPTRPAVGPPSPTACYYLFFGR